jgi:hypothetical protein
LLSMELPVDRAEIPWSLKWSQKPDREGESLDDSGRRLVQPGETGDSARAPLVRLP